jgi:hypothetical protein
LGVFAAQLDEEECEERAYQRDRASEERRQYEELDALIESFDEYVTQRMKAFLLVQGYRQHDRGEWRKRRVREQNEANDR